MIFPLYSVLRTYESINLKHANLKVTRCAQWWIVKCFTTICFAKSNIFVHPNGLTLTKSVSIQDNLFYIVKNKRTYPPPMVIIFESAAMNNSEPCPKFWSPSMPTHGYFALSGYKENKNVSPVPKYACRCPRSFLQLRSCHRVEQYAPNTFLFFILKKISKY